MEKNNEKKLTVKQLTIFVIVMAIFGWLCFIFSTDSVVLESTVDTMVIYTLLLVVFYINAASLILKREAAEKGDKAPEKEKNEK